MEAFSLLKYWRTNTNGGASGEVTTATTTTTTTTTTIIDSTANARATTKTLVTAAAVSPYSSDDEEGPYFDLQFALPDDDDDTEENGKEKVHKNEINGEDDTTTETECSSEDSSLNEEEEEEEEDEEVKLTLTTNECTDDKHGAVSPSEGHLFLNGDMVSIDEGSEDINSKFPVSLLKSATKFRILLLKLKKSKSGNGILEKLERNEEVSTKSKKNQEKQSGGKFCTVKFKVEEVKVPLVSLFKRENSSNKGVNKNDTTTTESDSDEKKLTKEVVLQKYLKMVKPLYIRVSKRYLETLKFSGQHGGGCEVTPPCSAAVKAGESLKTNQKQGNNNNTSNNLQAGFKVVRKHLGKSRSASSTVTAAAMPPEKMASNRRDDSLVQLQDGIQGAILHCKKSFNASRDVESSSSTILCRSTSDSSSSYEKSSAATSS